MGGTMKAPHPPIALQWAPPSPAIAGEGRKSSLSRLRERAGVRVAVATGLAIVLLPLLAGCGRKDHPDYPPDAVERPGALERRGEPIRYY